MRLSLRRRPCPILLSGFCLNHLRGESLNDLRGQTKFSKDRGFDWSRADSIDSDTRSKLRSETASKGTEGRFGSGVDARHRLARLRVTIDAVNRIAPPSEMSGTACLDGEVGSSHIDIELLVEKLRC